MYFRRVTYIIHGPLYLYDIGVVAKQFRYDTIMYAYNIIDVFDIIDAIYTAFDFYA